jgi:uncharacterized membrane protein
MPPHLGRVLQIVIGVVVLVTLLIVGVGALLPHTWHVEQSILINAPATSVHAWVSDLKRWPRWAQWNQADLWPRDQVGEPSAGTGASLHWYGRANGAGEVSTGEVRIVKSEPTAGVWFENRTGNAREPSRASVTYVERPGVTLVTWEDRGSLPPVVGGLFLDQFQKRLAEHMETGLERLKDLVELRAPLGATMAQPRPQRSASSDAGSDTGAPYATH